MRVSLLQLLIVMTIACVLCAVAVRIPVTRGIMAAFVFGGIVSLVVSKVGNMRVGQ